MGSQENRILDPAALEGLREMGGDAFVADLVETFLADAPPLLDALGRTEFDLMLLDVLMPEVDGYGVLAEMQGDPHLRDLPVIVTSALDELDSVVTCIEMGAEDYLTKPVNPVLLTARINASLEKKRLRDQQREL